MALIKKDFGLFPTMSDLFDKDWLNLRSPNLEWAPAVNVVDNDSCYELEFSAPGFKKEDFNISIDNRVLLVEGRHEQRDEEKKKNYTRKEFITRSFSKSFTLPENVDSDEVEATYEDGILKLILTKKQVELPPPGKRVEIK
ncbi:MAG: Hsp20/alpha crystallin family protein [Flavobacteriales bacterium]|nr:Hsp20/alpha crystallin family protein [Flavobacteriales bacterium]